MIFFNGTLCILCTLGWFTITCVQRMQRVQTHFSKKVKQNQKNIKTTLIYWHMAEAAVAAVVTFY